MFVPTYEYECLKCPRVFEVRQRITESALTTCDRCGGPIHRLLSAAPFILKGGGWYVTDYPSEARKQASKTESSSSESPAPSSTPAAEKSSTSTAAPSEKTKPAKADKPPSSTKSDKSTKSDRSKPASSDS